MLSLATARVFAEATNSFEIIPQHIESKPKVDIPAILVKIGKCESGNHQFNNEGQVFRGWYNHQDVGKYQINLFYHQATAEKMGINLFTEEGNTKYALYLLKTQGTTPWNWSKPCWGK